ncbi:MAG: hypothetical protein HY690_19290 [Chloroflexi bacterium]|nr:hypothetical protein [Chloroflexota bacterium]
MKHQWLLALCAAALFAVSLIFPYWTAAMKAPTYPEKTLTLQLYPFKYEGDIEEWNRVGRLVGVHVPPPVPEPFFQLFPAAILAAGVLGLATAASKRWLALAALYPWLVLGVLGIWGQYTLYLFGHSLDPERPLHYFDSFTPPIVGILTLGKIQTYHFPNVGSLLFSVAGALLVLNAWWAGKLPLPWRRAVSVSQR